MSHGIKPLSLWMLHNISSQYFAILAATMTEYGKTRHKPAPILFNAHVQERKAKRRKLIEEVQQRRHIITIRLYKKMQLQADNDLDTLPDI